MRQGIGLVALRPFGQRQARAGSGMAARRLQHGTGPFGELVEADRPSLESRVLGSLEGRGLGGGALAQRLGLVAKLGNHRAAVVEPVDDVAALPGDRRQLLGERLCVAAHGLPFRQVAGDGAPLLGQQPCRLAAAQLAGELAKLPLELGQPAGQLLRRSCRIDGGDALSVDPVAKLRSLLPGIGNLAVEPSRLLPQRHQLLEILLARLFLVGPPGERRRSLGTRIGAFDQRVIGAGMGDTALVGLGPRRLEVADKRPQRRGLVEKVKAGHPGGGGGLLPDRLVALALGPRQGGAAGFDLAVLVDFRIGAVALLLAAEHGLFARQTLVLEKPALVGRHQADSVKLGAQPLDAGFGSAAQLVHAPRNIGIDPGVGDLVEQRRPILRTGSEESVDIALGEENGAPELLEGEPGCSFNLPVDLPGLGRNHFNSSLCDPSERALHPLQPSVGPIPGAAHLPARQVVVTVKADELGLGAAHGHALTQDRALVAGRELLVVDIGYFLRTGVTGARILPVNGQANGIENGRFAGAGRTGYGEEAGALQRLGGEVNGKRLDQARQPLPGYAEDAHAVRPRPAPRQRPADESRPARPGGRRRRPA